MQLKIISNRSNYDLIMERYSCRRYFTNQPVSQAVLDRLREFPHRIQPGPYGNTPLIDFAFMTADQPEFLKHIRLSRLFQKYIHEPTGIAIVAMPGSEEGNRLADVNTRQIAIDMGFTVEQLLLYATRLGLQTCWVGGSYHRHQFDRFVTLPETHIVQAVPVIGHGYPRTYRTKICKSRLSGAKDEKGHNTLLKPWNLLFFKDDFHHPLEVARTRPEVFRALTAIRHAPSSCNGQPWRIVVSRNSAFHFFLKSNPLLAMKDRRLSNAPLQYVDMGIAMLHLVKTYEDFGKSLSFTNQLSESIGDIPSGHRYVGSWMINK